MKSLPIFEAKARLTQVLHQVEAGERFTLTRHGKPAAVLVNSATYEAWQNPAPSLFSALNQWRQETQLEALEEVFTGLRSDEPGRPADWSQS